MTRVGLSICLALAGSVVTAAQPANVRVIGPRSFVASADDLAAMPRTKLTTTVRDQSVVYEGVSIRELLTRAGVPVGEAFRGRDLAQAVIVTGADGYRIVFGIAEFDPAFTDRVAILADQKDGKPLTANEAPFQLVLTGEKRPARWVRQVVSIEIQSLAESKRAFTLLARTP